MTNVGIYLFDDVELLDFAGPFEVFSVFSEVAEDLPIKVFTVSQDGRPIRSVNGLKVLPDTSFREGLLAAPEAAFAIGEPDPPRGNRPRAVNAGGLPTVVGSDDGFDGRAGPCFAAVRAVSFLR